MPFFTPLSYLAVFTTKQALRKHKQTLSAPNSLFILLNYLCLCLFLNILSTPKYPLSSPKHPPFTSKQPLFTPKQPLFTPKQPLLTPNSLYLSLCLLFNSFYLTACSFIKENCFNPMLFHKEVEKCFLGKTERLCRGKKMLYGSKNKLFKSKQRVFKS